MSREDTLVCYADGSCFGNGKEESYGGYGLFGYLMKPAKKPKNVNYHVKNAFKLTSVGIVKKDKAKTEDFEITHVIDFIGSDNERITTNNRGELKAFIRALNYALEIESVLNLMVISDSKYVLENYENSLNKWVAKSWLTSTGTEVKNRDLWETIHFLRMKCIENHIKINTQWVKGHEDDIGNQLADMYAVIGTTTARNYLLKGDMFKEATLDLITPYKDFKKEVDDFHFAYHYKDAIMPTRDQDDDNVIFLASPKEETDIGKRNLLNSYLLVKGNVPDDLNKLKQTYRDLPRKFGTVFKMNLDIIKRDKMLSRVIDKIGFDCVFTHKTRNDFNYLELYDRSSRLAEDMDRTYPFIMEAARIRTACERICSTMIRYEEDGSIFNLNHLFLNEDKTLKTKFHDRQVDLTDLIKLKDYELVSKPIINIGKDTPPQPVMKAIVEDIKNVWLLVDTESIGNLGSFFFIIECEKDGKPYTLVQTNLMGKYLIRKI